MASAAATNPVTAAEESDAAIDVIADDGEASATTAAAAAAPKAAPKPRKQRTKPTYIRAFGDLLVKPEDRDNSRDAFETWRKDTKYLVDTITYTAWKQLKKAYYRDVAAVGRHTKKKAKTQDVRKTSENHSARLKTTLTADDFAELKDKWVSQYGFDGFYTAEQLIAGGCPTPSASSAYVVFEAAMSFGVKPKGIVSEKSKNSAITGELEFLEKVDGERVYVGISLPFRGKSKSKFSVEPNDRAYEVTHMGQEQQEKAPRKRTVGKTAAKKAAETTEEGEVEDDNGDDDGEDNGEGDAEADYASDDGNDDA